MARLNARPSTPRRPESAEVTAVNTGDQAKQMQDPPARPPARAGI